MVMYVDPTNHICVLFLLDQPSIQSDHILVHVRTLKFYPPPLNGWSLDRWILLLLPTSAVARDGGDKGSSSDRWCDWVPGEEARQGQPGSRPPHLPPLPPRHRLRSRQVPDAHGAQDGGRAASSGDQPILDLLLQTLLLRAIDDVLHLLAAARSQGSLDDRDSLISALKQVDVVVSTIAGDQILQQLKLVEAIKEAGTIKVCHPSHAKFVPSFSIS